MSEQHQHQSNNSQETAAEASNVVPFLPAPRSKHEAPPTDEELLEYRRIRPQLLAMLEQWPQLLKEHRAITSNCMLARKILAGDP